MPQSNNILPGSGEAFYYDVRPGFMSGFTPESFDQAAREIATANNLSVETARDYLVHVGDTPEIADDGRVIVRDESGLELARIILPEE